VNLDVPVLWCLSPLSLFALPYPSGIDINSQMSGLDARGVGMALCLMGVTQASLRLVVSASAYTSEPVRVGCLVSSLCGLSAPPGCFEPTFVVAGMSLSVSVHSSP